MAIKKEVANLHPKRGQLEFNAQLPAREVSDEVVTINSGNGNSISMIAHHSEPRKTQK